MPYILHTDRIDLKHHRFIAHNCGELNYLMTMEIIEFLEVEGDYSPEKLESKLYKLCDDYIKFKDLKYQIINDVIGALECCYMEFIRRKGDYYDDIEFIIKQVKERVYRTYAAPYEDIKIQLNGDVY